MNKFTILEEEYIAHYQAKFSLRIGYLKDWVEGLMTRGDALVQIEGTNGQRIQELKNEAERRHLVRQELARYESPID